MDQPKRALILTGNWKMNKTIEEARSFIEQLIPVVIDNQADVWLAVPFTMIYPLSQDADASPLVIGAQNMNDASEGAFTGEIAGKMLKEAGAKFVLLGHSERRRLYNEDNACINRKVKRAVEVGLRPVLCIGETLQEYEEGRTHEILQSQIAECLKDLSSEQIQSLILAYEPVWAIGTGRNATPEIAQEVHHFCRQYLATLFSDEFAQQIVIQYGGSVNPANANDLISQPDIDGLLVGGASLSLESFSQIVNDSKSKIQS
ncbi:triose-phosphate isomerase [Candidatus Protochlamydia phocaeensis]|uniref:triose-phosphate isomerase n=1 Tax=Candidatus Protochlamydia phocaeensis TaxID=1414722 RepID=UPI000838598D|nr:triose-phosphate isomerase [Candidatus Protochlamydia phocaeensis]